MLQNTNAPLNFTEDMEKNHSFICPFETIMT